MHPCSAEHSPSWRLVYLRRERKAARQETEYDNENSYDREASGHDSILFHFGLGRQRATGGAPAANLAHHSARNPGSASDDRFRLRTVFKSRRLQSLSVDSVFGQDGVQSPWT